jgi:hypothetical protein
VSEWGPIGVAGSHAREHSAGQRHTGSGEGGGEQQRSGAGGAGALSGGKVVRPPTHSRNNEHNRL